MANDEPNIFTPIPSPVPVTPVIKARFWTKVERLGIDDCWPWKAGKCRFGYGQFQITHIPRRAHRVAYWLTTGYWYGSEVVFRHTCDNRGCCNPWHIRLGTQAENMRDRMEREGYATIRGNNHWTHKRKLACTSAGVAPTPRSTPEQ